MKKGAMRGFGRVYKRADSDIWWIRYSSEGREYRESSKSTRYDDAVTLLQQRNKERVEGTFVPPVDRRVTVADLLDDLVAHYKMRQIPSEAVAAIHKKALLDVPPGTDEPGREGIGAIPAAKLTTARITRLVTYWQGEGLKPATINKRLGTLRAAYSLALKSNPRKVTVAPTFPRLEELNAREGFFEKGEFFAMLPHLPDDGLRDFVEWGYWTGMRKGEIAKLTWAAFDRETWTLTLPARSAKSRKPRRLPLRGPLRAILEHRWATRRLDCPLIFYRLHDGKPDAVHEFRKAWATACRAAGLTPGVTGRTFHDLRRSAVRNMIRAGVDRKVAMRISGHATEAMFSRYNIDTDEDTCDAVDKLAAYVDAIPATQTIVPIRVAQ